MLAYRLGGDDAGASVGAGVAGSLDHAGGCGGAVWAAEAAALVGGVGAVLFRLANTLDAMWGYKNARFLHFGWAAARIDDVLGYLPSRLTALSYALCGQTRRALSCWRRQAPGWDSPNAGPVMASGAGSLGVILGGAAIYHGQLEERPSLGEGRPPCGEDVSRAIALVRHSLALWLGLYLMAGVACA